MSGPYVYTPQYAPVTYHTSPYLGGTKTETSPFIPPIALGGSPYSAPALLPTGYPAPNQVPFPGGATPVVPAADPWPRERRPSWHGGEPMVHFQQPPNSAGPWLQTPYYHQRSQSFGQSTHPGGPPAAIHPAYYQTPPVSAPVYAPPPAPLAIHPLLNGENPPSDFIFDLSLGEFTPLRYMGNQQTTFLNKAELDEVATHPPITSLTIECDLIPKWPIKIIWNSDYAGLAAPPLTVVAILHVIWTSLQVNITHQEWAVLDDETTHKVSQAYTRRCKRMVSSQALAKNQGVKRVDFLLDKVYFRGLVRVGNGLDKMKLILGGP